MFPFHQKDICREGLEWGLMGLYVLRYEIEAKDKEGSAPAFKINSL